MRKVKIGLAILAVIGGLAGTLIAVWNLASTQMEYQKGEDAYEEIIDDYVRRPKKPEKQKDREETERKEAEQPEDYEYLTIDFAGLAAMNPDIIAWIDVPGAGISYPILQGEDNSFYLSHLSDRTKGIHGSVFVDYHNEAHFTDQNTIIYGHNMKDGTMFAPLDVYREKAKYLESTYFYIYTPESVLVYAIYSCYEGSAEGDAYLYAFSEEDRFLEFIRTTSDSSLYSTAPAPNGTDKVVTLSTCVNTSRQNRFILHGVLQDMIKEADND